MKNKIYVFFVLLSGVLWASSCLFVNRFTEWGFSSLECTSVRMVFGAILFNVFMLIKNPKGYKISLASFGLCVFSGFCSVLAMSLFYFKCMTETSAAVSAILLYTAPIFVMIMSVIFFKEKITWRKIVAFCLAIVGCALVSGIATGAKISTMGIVYGLLSGFCYSIYGIITAFYLKLNGGKGTLTFSSLSFLFAAIGSLVVTSPVEIVRRTVEIGNIPFMIVFFVLFGMCTAFLPFALYTKGLEGVRPDVASILAFVEPLAAAVLGIVILGQPFDAIQAVGIILVTSAIIVLNIPSRVKK